MARVLVVEDEAQVLLLAESVVQEAGYEALSAATVAEAQTLINSDEPFDLVVTDISLANHTEGGLTVGQLVEQQRKGTPVLYASGRELTDGMKAMFAERSAFLPKPYTAPELLKAISELLSAG